MSRLISLYPAAWRARYEPELRAILEDRPPSFRDRVDLVRGALDARLHPQLMQPGTADLDMPPEGRAPGLAAVAGGLTWLGVSVLAGLAGSGRSDIDFGSLVWISLFLMTIGLIGPLPAVRARQVRRGLVAGGILFTLGVLVPVDLKAIPFTALAWLITAGILAVAAMRAGLSSGRRWLVVGLGWLIPILILMGLFSTPGTSAGPTGADPGGWIFGLVLAPYGVAWTALGALMVLRGRSTVAPSATPADSSDAAA